MQPGAIASTAGLTEATAQRCVITVTHVFGQSRVTCVGDAVDITLKPFKIITIRFIPD